MAGLLTVTQCARRHSVSRAAIHAAIRRGALAAQRVGHVWVVSEADCDAYQPIKDARAKGRRAMSVRWGGPHQIDDT